MNKNLLIGAIVLLLIGGAAFALQNRKSEPAAPQSNNEVMSEASEFAKAMESGKPTVCTMSKGQDVMEYSIKGKKMRIKSTTSVANGEGTPKTLIGHMINDETYFYTWEDSSKQGSKISLAQASPTDVDPATAPDAAPKLESAADYEGFKNQGYTINCQASSFDDTYFTPPADVKFIDPTQFMQGSTGATPQIDMQKLQELQKQYGSQ